ncbi:MAG: hypothetical protein GWO30_03770, partial [Gammaproteobacteria bacterium]|nr:hypothetical protein [Gammaproteobacteria bacterium]NIQ09870.1 hypothetical protein [Gammaproteobacteria bacterium]NIR25895.1 hypothetical protein [Gammaproteobacteria bacterium]NIY19588.1 hypothetical protein [Gammaproteobacteria bacterium]
VNTGFNVDSFRRTYRDGILQRAQTFATAIKSQVEAVLNLGLPLDEISGISEICEETVAKDPDITYCMVEDSTGKALYTNKEHYPETISLKFLDNLSDEITVLDSDVLGELYDYSLPLYNYNDDV